MRHALSLPDGHGAPGVRGAAQAEDGSGLGEEAGRVSRVVPVTDHDALLVPRDHQVVISRGPVHRCDAGLCVPEGGKKNKQQKHCGHFLMIFHGCAPKYNNIYI